MPRYHEVFWVWPFWPVNLPSIYPLRCSSTALSGPTCALLPPWFCSSTISIDHLFHIFHMVIVHHIVLLLPHHVPVDQIHPGIDRPHLRMGGMMDLSWISLVARLSTQ